jgi:CheY-like chemotaxis protein
MVTAMIVEDSMSHYETYLEVLSYKGHHAIGATDGLMALDKLVENSSETSPGKTAIDIIFTDFNMPMMNGYDFSKAVKTDPKYARYANVPIIGIGDFPLSKREYLVDCKDKVSLKLIDFYSWIEKYCTIQKPAL